MSTIAHCGYTVGECVREALAQLDAWSASARGQQKALGQAIAAARALRLMWDLLPADVQQRLDQDVLLREQIRRITGYYGLPQE